MDLHVRYWDYTACEVRTSYWTSEFLGKASADDVLSKYDACASHLNKSKILHISFDGPSVNPAFLDLACKSRKEELLDPQEKKLQIGTLKNCCSQCTKIFGESLSHKADYERITSATSSDYPLNFCLHH